MIALLFFILVVAMIAFVALCLVHKKNVDYVADEVVNVVGKVDSVEIRVDHLADSVKHTEELTMENHYRLEELENHICGKYEKTFKKECLDMVASGIAIREVSRQKEVPYSTLCSWIKAEKKCTQA